MPMALDHPTAGLTLRPAESARFDLVALGEVMLRFDPGAERIAHTRNFRVWEGGGEYNVARGLRRCFGRSTAIVTALADNPVGRLVEDLMLEGGVDLSQLRWVPYDGVGLDARNGIYFLERGFGVRPGLGMMDRGHTPVSQLQPGQVDWDALFSGAGHGARWFHTGGVFCALSASTAAVAREAMQSAQRHGVVVSFDGNYRASLWKSRGGRQASVDLNRSLMPYVDVLFGHEGDVAANLIEASHGPVWHTLDSFGTMAERVTAAFPSVKIVASTVRRPITATRNAWGAFAYAGGHAVEARGFPELEIFDRVGGGDSFAAGLIHGVMAGRGLQWATDCGLAHGALAMTTPGDSSQATLAEVERLMQGTGAGTSR